MAFFHFPFGKITKNNSSLSFNGFTLIEVLGVLLLMSILSLIAVPSFQEWQERNAFKSFATRTAALAKESRIHALTEGKTVYLITQINSEQCILISEDKSCTCSTHKSCVVNDAAFWSMPTLFKMKLKTSNGEDKTLAFNRNGSLNFGDSTTFTLTSQRYKASVIINTLGRVKLCSFQPFVGIAQC
ncbi:Tfp pilus assembly protein FimT/FimU [Alteromonas gracilis]|uniref:pilus assembly FimT family protein n=1 Tax=Alteromonas gracilis TaxID=1479524 RepID=UPI003736073F